MVCDQCETVVHCTKHGCIPKQPVQGMTVIEMAREAGIHSPDSYKLTVSHMSIDTLKGFEALVRADEREQGQFWFDAVTAQHKQLLLAEREACAKLAATTVCDTHMPTGVKIYGTVAAKAIRARGNT